MAVTVQSNDTFLAFRRLLYSLSRQLTAKDKHGIIFIHFYNEKVTLEAASELDLLCKLESQGIATYNNPNGLLELMKDLKRSDLVGEVKDYMKKKKPSRKKSAEKEADDKGQEEENLELRATLEAAFVQATVLLQQMEKLHASTSGKPACWADIEGIVSEACQTSEALAERLRKAEAIGNKTTNGSDARNSDPAYYDTGYINALHSDLNVSNLFSSPLSALYKADSHKTSSMPAISKFSSIAEYKKADADDNDDDEDDDDDYEPMQPGVFSASAAKWAEQKEIGSQLNCPIPKPRNVRSVGDTRPIQYADVILPSRPNEKPSVISSPVPPLHSGTATPTAIPEVVSLDTVERRRRLSNSHAIAATAAAAAAKVVSKRWTRTPSEDELTRQPITARQKWAKPQGLEVRTNSNQLNNNWPRVYAKTDPVVGVTPISAVTDKRLSVSTQVAVPTGTSSPVKLPRRHRTDDNYTTLHRTEESQLSEPGYKTVRSLAVSLPHLSQADESSAFYKPLETNMADPVQSYTSVQHK